MMEEKTNRRQKVMDETERNKRQGGKEKKMIEERDEIERKNERERKMIEEIVMKDKRQKQHGSKI